MRFQLDTVDQLKTSVFQEALAQKIGKRKVPLFGSVFRNQLLLKITEERLQELEKSGGVIAANEAEKAYILEVQELQQECTEFLNQMS